MMELFAVALGIVLLFVLIGQYFWADVKITRPDQPAAEPSRRDKDRARYGVHR